MAVLKTIGQYALGIAVLMLIIAWAGACAVGKAWVRDNSPEWFYNISSPFLRGDDDFIQVGYDEYECADLADEIEAKAEDGDSDAFVILEDVRHNCVRDYRNLRNDVREVMEEEGLDASDIDCGLAEDAMLDALSSRDPPSVTFIGVAVQDVCPDEYASFVDRLK